jgi:hypothetical protein
MQPQLLDNEFAFGENADGLFVKHEQEIPDDFLTMLKDERSAHDHLRHSELNRVASVPTSVIEIWMKQGLDPFRMTPREVVARLKRDGLDAFLATSKRV